MPSRKAWAMEPSDLLKEGAESKRLKGLLDYNQRMFCESEYL